MRERLIAWLMRHPRIAQIAFRVFVFVRSHRTMAIFAILGVLLVYDFLAVVALIVIWAVVLTPAPAAGPTPTPTPAVAGTPVPTTSEYYEVAQWAEGSEQMVTVVSAERTDYYYPGWAPPAAPAETVYVIIDAVVTNVGNTALYISPEHFILRDSEGRWYTSGYYAGPGEFPDTNLAPGKTASGEVLFVVPEIASGLEVTFILDGAEPVLAVWQLEW